MAWNVLRGAFLVAICAGAWWSWRDSGDEALHAFREVDSGRVLTAGLLVMLGLISTGWVWLSALASYGLRQRPVEVLPLFFVSQLGKYIPGSVWSFAAQALVGRRHGLPPRASASTSVLFLGVHVASGLILVGIFGWASAIPPWLVAVALVGGLIGSTPAIYRRLGTRLAGQACNWTRARSLTGASLMLPVWTCYSLAFVMLIPGLGLSGVLTVGCAFVLAHGAGVAIPLAPAGLGAREVVLIALTAPVIGTGEATMVALVLRMLHAFADFTVAGVAGLLLKRPFLGEPAGKPAPGNRLGLTPDHSEESP